jgi:protein arginine kinase
LSQALHDGGLRGLRQRRKRFHDAFEHSLQGSEVGLVVSEPEIDGLLSTRLHQGNHQVDGSSLVTGREAVVPDEPLCPTNVGTGMRVSVMLHLPALVITRQIDKVFRSLQKISLAVRGLYGEGSQAMGDFYQISNQITLGRSEKELLGQVADVVPVIIDYERKARDFLLKESQKDLHDRVSRARGILCTAQTISSEETMHLLSSLRMGVNLGLIKDLEIPTINKLFINTQPAHLQKIRGSEMDTSDRNIERAHYLQRHLQRREGESEKN